MLHLVSFPSVMCVKSVSASAVLLVLILGASTVPLQAATPAPGPNWPPFNSTWLRSSADDTDLQLSSSPAPNGKPAVLWNVPRHFTGLFTYLPKPLPLQRAGDAVNLTVRWRSNGTNLCPSSCYADNNYCQQSECQHAHCASKSVQCLAGTGDFRIALLDTRRARLRVEGDNWCNNSKDYGKMTSCVESEPFASMQGYDFRIFPHLTTHAKHEPGQVPCSIYKKDKSNLFGKERLGEWGCFATPLGEWTTLSLFLKRRSEDRIETGMAMNGITYEAEDTGLDPKSATTIGQVDAVAIGYPNGRMYTYVEMASAA
eukprot:UC1_evm1s979